MTDDTDLEIPEDIRFAAADIGEEVRRYPGATDWIIARAILAERERCAKVAETRHEHWRMPYPDDAKPGEVCDDITACADIANAIRKGVQP